MKPHWGIRGFVALLAVLLCTACVFPLQIAGAAMPRKVIRVGFPNSPRLSEVDEKGNLSGYTYEYLQQISQYTGWEYEFVQLQGTQNEVLTQMYDMLAKGELDLMGATNYSKELDEQYDYSASNYGSVYATLAVLEENTSINNVNYRSLYSIRVAALAHASKGIAALERFCSENRITLQLIPCDSAEDQLAALQDNRADALLANDVVHAPETRIVARFNPQPFYFAATNGNDEVISKLNSAMLLLNDSDPYFLANLHQKYFSSKANLLCFSNEEKRYLAASPVLRVGLVRDRLPLEDVDPNGAFHGISVDLLNRISGETGLQFELVVLPSMEALLTHLEKDEIDLALGMTYDYAASQRYNFSLSRPYLSAQLIMAVKVGISPNALNGKRLALPRGMSDPGADWTDSSTVIWCDSIVDCLKAVNEGVADYCYGNGYSMEYYCNLHRYRYLMLVPQSSHIDEYCIGLARPAHPLLLTILNKTIRNFSESELQSVIYQNSAPSTQGLTLHDIIEENPVPIFSSLFLLALLICAFLCYFAWFQRRTRQKVQVENERYQLLSELSGEFLFEYDFISDRLTLTEKTAQAFGGNLIQEHYLHDLSSSTADDAKWLTSIYNLICKKKSLILEHQTTLADGRRLWLRITIVAITDANGHANYLIGKLADIQAEKQERDELAIKAKTDGLTGLYHITESKALIERLLEQETGPSAGTLLIMDIDHFKSINDQFGHYTGDQVLRDVAAILQKVFRTKDILGRLGGDEFIVFLKGMTQESAVEKKCRALQCEIAAHSSHWPVPVTLSIGAAIANSTMSYDALYHLTDNALYIVKSAGRNHFNIISDKSYDN
ncbi:MAG: transporter substrate-binding domain-containing protein [Oscillospiraceae bacterium]